MIAGSAGTRWTRCPNCSRLVIEAADLDGRALRLEAAMRGVYVEVAHVNGERNARFGRWDAREGDGVSDARFTDHVCRK
jgi:hypothetical protein